MKEELTPVNDKEAIACVRQLTRMGATDCKVLSHDGCRIIHSIDLTTYGGKEYHVSVSREYKPVDSYCAIRYFEMLVPPGTEVTECIPLKHATHVYGDANQDE
jgi:hypothetical protein